MADPITQADREAAWKHRPACYAAEDKDGWMCGVYDTVVPIIQTLAAHRIAAEQACADKIARLQRERDQAVEALRTIRDNFARSEEQGYHTADREFAISIASPTLASIEGAEDEG